MDTLIATLSQWEETSPAMTALRGNIAVRGPAVSCALPVTIALSHPVKDIILATVAGTVQLVRQVKLNAQPVTIAHLLHKAPLPVQQDIFAPLTLLRRQYVRAEHTPLITPHRVRLALPDIIATQGPAV